MLTIKQPFEEAKAKLGDKIVDIRSKTLFLHKVIDEISKTPVLRAENMLKGVLKKDFFSKYIKVSQELEGCLGQLLLILDTVGSFGIIQSEEEVITNVSASVGNMKDNDSEIQDVGCRKNMAQLQPLSAGVMHQETNNMNNNDIKKIVVNNFNNDMNKSVTVIPQVKKFKRNGVKSNERVTCHLCGKTVRGNYELKVHLACRHTSESKSELKYVCMLCPTDPKRYARGDRLKEHIERIHLNISNKHVCTLCGRGFNRPGRRNKHQMLCKGVDQDVEVIITEDNVLVSSKMENLEHSVRNNEENGTPMHDSYEKKIMVENIKDNNEVRFYNESMRDTNLSKEESNSKILKQEPMETNVQVFYTTSSSIEASDSGGHTPSNVVNESDTLHISENDTMEVTPNNEINDTVHIITSKQTDTAHNSCSEENDEHPIHIMSDRNSMVM